MTELLVGTRKGLFVLDGTPGARFAITARHFADQPVDYAMREPLSGRVLAAVTSPFYGPRVWYCDDLAAGEWSAARGIALPKGGSQSLRRIWVIVASDDGARLWAGGDPGVLFESRDGGASFELNEALWRHESRPRWRPDSGGLSVHSIAPWPGDPGRIALGISAAGVMLTDDGGATWRHGNTGIVADYLPLEARATAVDLCVHHLERAPGRPERLFLQFHGGVYRSDDGGESWIDIAAGLPSDFGFPVVVDPADPDSAFVIPVTTEDRVVPGGRVLVWETRDAGATWTPHGDGLPPEDAYVQVLRQAFDRAGAGPDLELYFGASTGEIFGSGDGGVTWFEVARRLPPIASVRTSVGATSARPRG